jgi:hypothetical protein
LQIVVPASAPAVNAAQERSKAEVDAESLARTTLITKLSVAPERVTTVSVAPMQWRDSSLGCPQRGMTYAPVLTSGYEVKLLEADREHVVHVAGGRAVICGTPFESKQPPLSKISGSLQAAAAVRTALAARLGIEPARVRIVSTRPFRSASAQCPAAPSARKGTALVVEAVADAQTFRYYADDAQVLSCVK